MATRDAKIMDHADRLLASLQRREALFGADLFSDPAWHIILTLAAQPNGRLDTESLKRETRLSEKSLGRWLDALKTKDLIVCSAEHIALTQKGMADIDGILGG